MTKQCDEQDEMQFKYVWVVSDRITNLPIMVFTNETDAHRFARKQDMELRINQAVMKT